MADYRTIHSKIWEDDWFCSLSAEEKVLWFYLITNHRASVSGIYILPERVIPFETGLDAETVKMILAHFIADEKIVCEQNVIWVKKLRDYQETKSNTIQKCIMKDVERIPDGPVKQAYCIRYGYPIDTLSIPICTTRHDTTRHDTSTTRHDTTKTGTVITEKRTILQELDRLMPGRVNSKVQQEIGYLIDDHTEARVVECLNNMLGMNTAFNNPVGYLRSMLNGKNNKSPATKINYDPTIPDNMPGGKNRPRI